MTPEDLKDYQADDPFVLLTPDLAIVLLCIIILLFAITERFL